MSWLSAIFGRQRRDKRANFHLPSESFCLNRQEHPQVQGGELACVPMTMHGQLHVYAEHHGKPGSQFPAMEELWSGANGHRGNDRVHPYHAYNWLLKRGVVRGVGMLTHTHGKPAYELAQRALRLLHAYEAPLGVSCLWTDGLDIPDRTKSVQTHYGRMPLARWEGYAHRDSHHAFYVLGWQHDPEWSWVLLCYSSNAAGYFALLFTDWATMCALPDNNPQKGLVWMLIPTKEWLSGSLIGPENP